MKIYVNQNPEPPVKRHLKLGGKASGSEPHEETSSRVKGFANRFTKKNPEDKVATRDLIKNEADADASTLDGSGEKKPVDLSEGDKNSETEGTPGEPSEAKVTTAEESDVVEQMSDKSKKRGLNPAKKGKKDAASVVVATVESEVHSSSSVSLVAIAILILCFALSLAFGFFSGETIFKFVIDRGLFR